MEKEEALFFLDKVDRLRGELPVTLFSTLTNRGPVVTLEVGPEDAAGVAAAAAAACSMVLRIRLTEWTPTDVLELLWDGEDLGSPQEVRSAAT